MITRKGNVRGLRMGAIFLILGLLAVWSAPALAIGIWKDGKVTKGPWLDRIQRIEIDDQKFFVMPEARIIKLTKNQNNQFIETPTSIGSVRSGQKVRFMVEGFRIFQLVVIDRSSAQ